MPTTLVTGGTGFIGANLARLLQDAGDKIVLFDAAPDVPMAQELGLDAPIIRGDVTLLGDIIRAVKEHHVDRIAHMAYIIGPENEQNPPRALNVNAIGNNNIWEAARIEGLQRVSWTSSVSLYGKSSGRPEIDEDDATWPTRVYGALKQFNEHMAEHYYHEFGVEHIAVRPSSVYGPGRTRGSLQYIQDWLNGAAREEHITIQGGDEMDNWSYVEDVAGALAAAVLAPELPERRIFNIGGDYRSRSEFAAYVQSLVPAAQVELVPGVTSNYRPRHRNSNIAEMLGFKPKWSMEEGVKKTLNWYRERAGKPPVD